MSSDVLFVIMLSPVGTVILFFVAIGVYLGKRAWKPDRERGHYVAAAVALVVFAALELFGNKMYAPRPGFENWNLHLTDSTFMYLNIALFVYVIVLGMSLTYPRLPHHRNPPR